MSSSEAHLRRVQRVEREIKEAVASFIVQNIQREISGLLTITRVQMPADLRTGKVFFTVLASQQSNEEVLNVLQKWAPETQHHLSKTLRLRFIPRLTFEFDLGVEKSLRVEKIFHDIAEERKRREEPSEE